MLKALIYNSTFDVKSERGTHLMRHWTAVTVPQLGILHPDPFSGEQLNARTGDRFPLAAAAPIAPTDRDRVSRRPLSRSLQSPN